MLDALSAFILPAMSFGMSAVTIPGPLQALLINVTLQYGWRRALWVVIAPPIVDIPIIIVVVFLLGQLPPVALQLIRILGGLLLLWIAWGAYQQYRAGAQLTAPTPAQPAELTPRRTLLTAMAMNAISPGPYLFWSTVTGPLLLSALDVSVIYALAFLVAFYGTFLGGLVLLSIAIARLGAINARLTSYLLLLTIGLLVFFGTALIAEALNLQTVQRLLVLPALLLVGLWHLWRQTRPSTSI